MTSLCHRAISKLPTSRLPARETINTYVLKLDFEEFQFVTLNAISN